MDKHYKNIKNLIENNLVEIRKQELNVNYHTIKTNYEIGKEIVRAQSNQKRAKYGTGLINKYAIFLEKEYGAKYKRSNLMLMRQFYLTFQKVHALRGQLGESFPKVVTLSRFLSWSHFKILLPIKEEDKRNYYINSCVEHNFSSRQLINYIKSNAYERLVNKDNIELKYIDGDANENITILNMIKDPILITINKSIDKITEKALKKFMLEQIEKTMLELGIGFYYGGSEIPIKVNNKTLRPDLVFFNTELNCHVIIELKLNELTIKDIGQIEFYVKYYDSNKKKPFHNPTIGITISKKVDKNMIEVNKKDNIEHSTYKLV